MAFTSLHYIITGVLGYQTIIKIIDLYNYSYDVKSIDIADKCSLKVFSIKLHSIGKLQFNRL